MDKKSISSIATNVYIILNDSRKVQNTNMQKGSYLLKLI